MTHNCQHFLEWKAIWNFAVGSSSERQGLQGQAVAAVFYCQKQLADCFMSPLYCLSTIFVLPTFWVSAASSADGYSWWSIISMGQTQHMSSMAYFFSIRHPPSTLSAIPNRTIVSISEMTVAIVLLMEPPWPKHIALNWFWFVLVTLIDPNHTTNFSLCI